MLDGTIPPELHEKYLGIVLNETERLTKLTNSLLTLNNLNMKGMILEKICFRFKFGHSLYCRFLRRNLPAEAYRHRALLTGDRMPVLADKSKIEQVLYNLLDNAIKFSHPDSAIRIETNEKHGKVFVSVKDSGIGIPKDSLRLIFDRFYKTDLPVAKTKREPGWDFPLQKEIIQAHNENINVISTEGVGSEFIFSLPVQDNKRRAGCLTLSSAAGAVLHFPVTLRNDSGAALHTKRSLRSLTGSGNGYPAPSECGYSSFHTPQGFPPIPALSLPNII